MRHILIIFVMCITHSFAVSAQENEQLFTESERRQVINKISDLLARNYVDAQIGELCKNYFKNEYNIDHLMAINHPRAFVREINESLFNIHKDKHVRLTFIPPEEQRLKKEQPEINILLQTLDRKLNNYGFQTLQILPDNVGYLNLTSFAPVELARDKLFNTIGFFNNCDALIIDLRENRGGDLGMVCHLAGYFFDRKILFSSYYWRRGDYTEEFWTRPDSCCFAFPKMPLFILTSNKTFSAAEDFANGMKNQKRAMLIGEVTGGGAHPGFTFSVNQRFSVFIPTGKAVDPVYGGNWEKTGVEPDIKTSSNSAYVIGLEKAAFAARSVRSKTNDNFINQYWDLVTELKKDQNQVKDQVNQINAMLDQLVSQNRLDEWTINRLGYHFMQQEQYGAAEILFRYNLKKFSHSVNTYDSMGEFYYRTGNKKQSIEFYQQVLSLDPTNQHAAYMLNKLGEKP